MKRRQLLGWIAAGLVVPSARAQQAGRVVRIGRLCQGGQCPAPTEDQFFLALRALGWVEGHNLEVERRWGNAKDLARAAAELVARKPDLIFTVAPPTSIAARNATSSIPIVFMAVADPVKSGLVESFGRPGGNATGLATVAGGNIIGKQLQVLKEIVPRATHVALLINPDNVSHRVSANQFGADAEALQLRGQVFEARSADAIESALANAARGNELLIQLGDTVLSNPIERVPQLALRARLPSAYLWAAQAQAGGLISYGPDILFMYRRAAEYADRILKGARPTDLPVEQPTKFELVINLKTARALGLSVPQSTLLRADRLIE